MTPEELSAYKKKWRAENKADIRRKTKIWREENRERLRDEARKYYARNKEKCAATDKIYRENNKDKKAAANKKYSDAHKDKARVYNIEYRRLHKEEKKVQDKLYRENHIERCRALHDARYIIRRDKVNRSYVASMLKIPIKHMSDELYQLKREQIFVKRGLVEINKVVKQLREGTL